MKSGAIPPIALTLLILAGCEPQKSQAQQPTSQAQQGTQAPTQVPPGQQTPAESPAKNEAIPYQVVSESLKNPAIPYRVIIIDPKYNSADSMKKLAYQIRTQMESSDYGACTTQVYDDLEAATNEKKVYDDPMLMEPDNRKSKARLKLERHTTKHFRGSIVWTNLRQGKGFITYYPKGTFEDGKSEVPSENITL